jgi:predicted naringenin-chalcone synthase
LTEITGQEKNMGTPRVLAIGTAVPENRYEQITLYENVLRQHFPDTPKAETIFRNTGVGWRSLAVPADFYHQERGTQARNELYLQAARSIGEQAIRRCLDQAGMDVSQVDDFIVVSCTGIDTPGLDLLLAGQMGMRSDLKRSTILGMGCYAALPGLQRVRDSVLAHPGRTALLLCVEICSLHFQSDDDSIENAVCSALFGDGAAAVLIGVDDPPAGGGTLRPALVDFETACDYQTLDRMAFHLTDHGFQMRLSAYVPKILSANIEAFVDGMLVRNGLRRVDVSVWAAHPGSAKILDYTAEKLALSPGALECSYEILRQYGNMSSPTILFILNEIQKESLPAAGDYGVILAFGPGLTIEGALLKW